MNPAGIRRERIEHVVNKLEEFIMAYIDDRIDGDLGTRMRLNALREDLIKILIEESRI